MNNKYGVFAKEVYMHLDINPATLRNWSSMIELQKKKRMKTL
ncbi:hypothetical protein ABWL24_24345 [Priestia megaterium]